MDAERAAHAASLLHHPAAPDGPPPRAGEEFAAAAARLAGLAGVMFGWRPGEFWAATPAELGVLVAALRGEDALPGPVDLAGLMERFPDDR